MTWEVPSVPLGSFLKEYQNNPTSSHCWDCHEKQHMCVWGASYVFCQYAFLISVGFYWLNLLLTQSRNIKEIAKLRGSEDLWEVAKLHNCESSFPKVKIVYIWLI